MVYLGMIRITGTKGNFQGKQIEYLDYLTSDEKDEIIAFLMEGDAVILVEDLEDLSAIGINPEDVDMSD